MIDDGGQRLVDLVHDRRRQLSHAERAREIRELALSRDQRLLGAAALFDLNMRAVPSGDLVPSSDSCGVPRTRNQR